MAVVGVDKYTRCMLVRSDGIPIYHPDDAQTSPEYITLMLMSDGSPTYQADVGQMTYQTDIGPMASKHTKRMSVRWHLNISLGCWSEGIEIYQADGIRMYNPDNAQSSPKYNKRLLVGWHPNIPNGY